MGILKIIGKTIVWFVIAILVLLSGLAITLTLPSVQTFITNKVTDFISKKTNSRARFDRVEIIFPNSVVLKKVFIEDDKKDTLLYAGSLVCDIKLLALINKTIEINKVSIKDLTASVYRSNVNGRFNFQFIIDAFSGTSKIKPVETDTTQRTIPWKFDIDEISLENINVAFLDSVSGTLFQCRLQHLYAEVDEFDLQTKLVDVASLYLVNAKASLIQQHIAKSSVVDTPTVPFKFLAGKVQLDNVNFVYNNEPELQNLTFAINKSFLRNGSVDLAGPSIKAGRFELADSKIGISIPKNTTGQKSAHPVKPSNRTLAASEFKIEVANLNLNRNTFDFNFVDEPLKHEGIDYNHLSLTGLKVKGKNLYFKGHNIRGNLQELAAKEKSGLEVKQLATNFIMDEKHAELANLYLKTKLSKITRYASLHFSSWKVFSNNIGRLSVNAVLEESRIHMQDVIQFAPSISDLEIIKKNKDRIIKLDASISGRLGNLVASQMTVSTGEATYFNAQVHITGLPDIKKAYFDITLPELRTTKRDLALMLSITLLSSFNLPDTVTLNGDFKGKLADFVTSLNIHSSDGHMKAYVAMRQLNDEPEYKADIDVKRLNIGKILKQDSLLGLASFSGSVVGHGFSKDKLNFYVKATVDSFYFNKYTYRYLTVKGRLKGKEFKGHARMNDPNLIFTFNGKANLEKDANKYDFVLDIKGSDLRALNLSDKDIQFSGLAQVNMTGNDLNNINGKASLKNLVIYSNYKKYEIDSLLMVTINKEGKNSFEMNSSIIKARFNGNIALAALPSSITNHIDSYLNISKRKKEKPQNFDFEVKIGNSPLISEIFVPGLESYIPGVIKGNFDSETNKMALEVNIISLNYVGNNFENLRFTVDSDKDKLDYSLTFDQFANKIVNLQKTSLSGQIKDNIAGIDLTIQKDKKTDKLKIHSQLRNISEGVYRYNISPKGFVLNNEEWNIPQDNYIEFGKKGLLVRNLNLSKEGQLFSVNSTGSTDPDMDIVFRDLQLSSLSQLIEKGDSMARGKMNGKITLKNYKRQIAFVSDLSIKQASYKSTLIGDVVLKADNLSQNKYMLSADISGNKNDIKLNGFLEARPSEMGLNLNLDLNNVNLSAFEGFALGQVSGLGGAMKGNMKLTGNTSDPKLNGYLNFVDAAGKVTILNQRMKLKDETIKIDPNGIYFSKFTILDEKNHEASVKGAIYMKSFKDFKYNVDIATNNFMVMNSTVKNNKMLNGRVILNSRFKIRGDHSVPDIDANVKLLDGSSINFTVPESEVSADRGEDVIEFEIDSGGLNPIMTRALKKQSKKTTYKGINLFANIEVNKQSALKLMLDPTQNDSLIVKGDAQLSFSLEESGKMSLSGTYVVSQGSYEISFEDIVGKKFYINSGSTITWNGNPLNAYIDITAQYNVRTSPASLLAGGGGAAGIDSNAVRNALNFMVLMYLKGNLLKPQIRFQLDMLASQRNALGGAVYTKLNSLNNNESELNKQVFSLLVLGSFMPGSGSSGSGGTDYNGMARSSVSSILTSQLNSLSSQYMKGVELNFDLQSYNDYSGTKKAGNTQLNVGVKKQFLNDRLSVQLGSNVGLEGASKQNNNMSNFTGNVVVEYKLTEDGRYKVKVFRQNQYEGLIDGMVTRTGTGFMYTRDYNTLKELFQPKKKE